MTPLRVDVVIVACAVSAGIHGALSPEHFGEGAPAGLGFALSAAALAAVALVLTRRPASRTALAGSAALFAGLIASYALAVTTGVPVLHPDVEPVDGLALFTKTVELVGLVAASTLLGRPTSVALVLRPKGA